MSCKFSGLYSCKQEFAENLVIQLPHIMQVLLVMQVIHVMHVIVFMQVIHVIGNSCHAGISCLAYNSYHASPTCHASHAIHSCHAGRLMHSRTIKLTLYRCRKRGEKNSQWKEEQSCCLHPVQRFRHCS